MHRFVFAGLFATSCFASAAFADQPLPSEPLPLGASLVHIRHGAGANPAPDSHVLVHYRGTLADGREFDSSYRRGRPAGFPLNGVIPCWTHGVARMKEGGKAVLTCPGPSAYGAAGIPGIIPPNATLRFEVELISILR